MDSTVYHVTECENVSCILINYIADHRWEHIATPSVSLRAHIRQTKNAVDSSVASNLKVSTCHTMHTIC